MEKELQKGVNGRVVLVSSAEFEKKKRLLLDRLFDNKLRKFLRKLKKKWFNELIYSRTLPAWEKDRKKRRVVKYLKKSLEYPKHICQVVNILKTLNKYYDVEINRKGAILAIMVWQLFEGEIDQYFSMYRVKAFKEKTSLIKHNSRQAFKEQKARGFIHINDFEEYDKEAKHCYSLVKRDYVYPVNFYCNIYGRDKYKTHVTIGGTLVGVSGFSRITQ